jgi:hypothetical protein
LLKALDNEAFLLIFQEGEKTGAGHNSNSAVNNNSPLTAIRPGGITSIPH